MATIPYYATPRETFPTGSSTSTCDWSIPVGTYVMKGLQVGLTSATPGHSLYVFYTEADGTVHGLLNVSKAYGSAWPAGDYVYDLPTSYWQGLTSGTLSIRTKAVGTNISTHYTNIRLIVEYEEVASKSTVVVQDAVAGQPQTVNLTNTEPTVYHWVNWGYGTDLSNPTVTSGSIQYDAATRSPAWAVPSARLASLYQDFPNSAYINGRVIVDTLTASGASVGDQVVSCRLSVPQDSSTLPTISMAITKTHDSIGTASGADYLQYHTTLNIQPTATAKASASVAGITISTPDGEFAGTSGSVTNIPIRTNGSYTITATVTDSRGFTATATQTITVTTCTLPAITSLTLERCEQDGTPTDEGTYVNITATANVTISSWAYSIVQSGKTTIVDSGTLSGGTGIVGNGLLNKDLVYVVTVTATDSITQTATASQNLGTALYTIHRMSGGKGVAFGTIARQYGVEVAEDWPFYTHGKEIMQLMLDLSHPVGSVIQTIDATFDPNGQWPWSHWNKLENVFLLGSGTRNVLDIGGVESATVSVGITAEEKPYYLKQDQLPTLSVLGNAGSAYGGTRSVSSRNHGNAGGFGYVQFNADDAYPMYTMRFGLPEGVAEYDSTKAYAIGNYVLKTSRGESKLYRCEAAVAANETWSDYKWTEIPYIETSGSSTISTMPPYITVNIWVRVQ